MGRKGGKYKKKETNVHVKNNSVQFESDDEDMIHDEIDAFHKNRDVVPLNIDGDMEGSDEDNEQPVLDIEDEEDEDTDDDDDEEAPKGLAAKIARTQKYLRDKFGEPEDEVSDDADEEDKKKVVWGRKRDLYGADVNYEPQSSDDEDAAEEEAEVLKLQIEKAKMLSKEDFGLEDSSEDETYRDPTFEEILDHGKPTSKVSHDKGIKDVDGMTYEMVKKDLNALTKEEQMDAVYSSAPELVSLLSELNEAVEQLETKVNPLVDKIKGSWNAKKGEMHYLEVKQVLLLMYIQAITFYLLLKSEGHPVRDHPVLSRLVEVKSLLDKVKQFEDDNLPADLEAIVNKMVAKEVEKTLPAIESVAGSSGNQTIVEPNEAADLNTLRSLDNSESKSKHQDKQVGLKSMEMLRIRASLEEKLKQKGAITLKNVRRVREHMEPLNRRLETLDDFVDEEMEIDQVANGRSNTLHQLTHNPNKRKVISGDDDVPRRDDIGERRRKHELRVLAGAGIKYGDDVENEAGNVSDGDADVSEESEADSDFEDYKQEEQQHDAKLAVKSIKQPRTPQAPSLPDDTLVNGRRPISQQILKNRGLTRPRKKLIKNPRKKYKLKHKKAEVRRKGQVREMRKPTGPYGGEASGINVNISRSIRFC